MPVLQQFCAEFAPGDRVTCGNGVEGTVEEVHFLRNACPMVVVDYWHNGEVITRRFHIEDCKKVPA